MKALTLTVQQPLDQFHCWDKNTRVNIRAHRKMVLVDVVIGRKKTRFECTLKELGEALEKLKEGLNNPPRAHEGKGI